ncbi:MAG: kelch repeat-containing protein [Thermomicrobiales bacterium]
MRHRGTNRRTFVAASVAMLGIAAGREAVHGQPPFAAPAEEWTSSAALPAPRSEFAATVLAGKIYIAGGFGADSDFTRFDPESGEWTELAPLPAPRHHLGLAALGDAVYVAGGHTADTNTATDTFWRYDPDLDHWEDGPVLPQGPRGALGCAALGDRLYAVGGSSGDLGGPATADVACFDPERGTWSMAAPLPTAREHLAVAATSTRLLAIGGRNGGADIGPELGGATEIYDPSTDSWERGTSLPVPRSGMGAASDGDVVIVLGGEGPDGVYDQVNRYDPATDEWSSLPDLPQGRHGVGAAIVDRTLYAIGGSTLAWSVQNIFGVDSLRL